MSRPVDVLASFARDTGGFRCTNKQATELAEACAAVAELVDDYRKLLAQAEGMIEEEYPKTMWAEQKKELEPYRAALAKFGGAK